MITKLHHQNSNDKTGTSVSGTSVSGLDHHASGPEIKEKIVKLMHEKPISTLYFT
jgi:hypothetical protein